MARGKVRVTTKVYVQLALLVGVKGGGGGGGGYEVTKAVCTIT